MASLDGIVPPTNGLTIGAAGMVNVFLSTEHQSILWCNQLVMQVSRATNQLCAKVKIYCFKVCLAVVCKWKISFMKFEDWISASALLSDFI